MSTEKENRDLKNSSQTGCLPNTEHSKNNSLSLEEYKVFFEALEKELISSATDENGNIIYANNRFVEISKYSRDELIGKNHRILKSGFHPPEFYQELWNKITSGKTWRSEIKNRAKDGSSFWVDTSIAPILGPDGKPKKFVSVGFLVTEQKALKKIEHESQYVRSLIEASLDPLVTISADGKITDVNEGLINATGVPREKLIGTDFSDYFTEPEKARQGYQQVFAKGSVTDYPLTIRHIDGKLTDVLYNASVYKDIQGNVLGVFAAARDVTESKSIMQQFIETKKYLDNILQSSVKYSIIGTDLNANVLSWNEGARQNYGYTDKEIIGKNCSILHTDEDIQKGSFKALLETALKEGLAENEFERVRKDGSRFIASLVVTRRLDASGKPIGFLVISNDISEKKRVEKQLKQASENARNLIEASLDPLVTISPDGKITDVNEASVKVTGVPRNQLIGTDFSNYFTEPEKARRGYQQVFAKGAVADYPLTIRRTDGLLTHVLYNASVYRDTDGNVIGVFAAARDVTAQRKAEEELIDQRRKELQRLAELEKFQKVTVGRELKMIELKSEIEDLKKEIEALRNKST